MFRQEAGPVQPKNSAQGSPCLTIEKAPHCGALWLGGGRLRPPPFISHKIERAESRSITPARTARKRAQAAQNAGDIIQRGQRPASYSKSAHSGPQGQTGGYQPSRVRKQKAEAAQCAVSVVGCGAPHLLHELVGAVGSTSMEKERKAQ